eukprot:gb/GECG01013907.1/.p1 GENE.gb/GECG01013907.1/~~gb/GECG01013907.1/.p1  ORF type:complete len:950 (+),score=157.59 gb/GECG01013907.1/:1-2850(+)
MSTVSVQGVQHAFDNFRKRLKKKMTAGGSDGQYFTSSKRGEIPEIREELKSNSIDTMKDAVKKVIAGLTVGKDMSEVFPDVLNCIRTENHEIKKLVYLYLINYAKSNPDLALLAVNAFVQDSRHPNPLIRALAVRTMGCIRVERITEYLGGPLKKALTDEDPYVRKTAAICVAKLHDISPSVVRDQGFLSMLRDLLSDANATVVANAMAALAEIQEHYPRDIIALTGPMRNQLLAALDECTEWGQVFILDALGRFYSPPDGHEAENVIERILPRLKHQNSAVVLAAVKVVMLYMEHIQNDETLGTYQRKLAPPLVTLAQSAQPEVQYVALRNISLIVQKRQKLLSESIKVFFCKYNDPIYVKMEKLEILVQLVNEQNVDNVLLELKEYAQEVDVEYVRRAVRTIGRCAIKLEKAAERCIKVLLQLIKTQVNYVVQEAIVVIKDIFRRYPNRYESIIAVLCESLESVDEPEAKASMVWIIGEYADRIENAEELMESFIEGFHEETNYVQLTILTAVVKLFLVKAEGTEQLVEDVLRMSTEESDNPDLRDRGFVYWRLLSTDPDAAKEVVLASKPTIEDDTNKLDATLLDNLLHNMGTLASVYHKPPEAFVKKSKTSGELDDDETESEEDESSEEDDEEAEGNASEASAGEDDLLDLGLGGGEPKKPKKPAASAARPPQPPAQSDSGLEDIFGDAGAAQTTGRAEETATTGVFRRPQLVEKNGIIVHGALKYENGVKLRLGIRNNQNTALDRVQVAINKNGFGLSPAVKSASFGGLASGSSGEADIALTFDDRKADPKGPCDIIDVALKDANTGTQLVFKLPIDVDALFKNNGQLEQQEFQAMWQSLEGMEEKGTVKGVVSVDPNHVKSVFKERRLFFVHGESGSNGQHHYNFSAKVAGSERSTLADSAVLVVFTTKEGVNNMCQLRVRVSDQTVANATFKALQAVLQGTN